MKQIISLLLSLFLIVAFSGCHNSVDTGDMPPMIDMYGQKYVAPNMPVNELPQGYTYLGELSKEQANGTGLEGCKMYAVTELDSIPDFIYIKSVEHRLMTILWTVKKYNGHMFNGLK